MNFSDTIISLAPLLVFAPLTGLLLNLLFGRRWSETVVGAVASLASGAAFVVSVLLTYALALNHGEVVERGRWAEGYWFSRRSWFPVLHGAKSPLWGPTGPDQRWFSVPPPH